VIFSEVTAKLCVKVRYPALDSEELYQTARAATRRQKFN